MLALCHMDGITARYVTGILPGKTELHSWVEVQAEDGIFYGMDPEFGIPVTESYIAFCQGRDARECSLLVSGSAGEKEGEIQVSVEAAPSEKKEYALMPESGNIHWLARKMAVRNSSFQSIPLDRLNRVMGNLEFTILSILKRPFGSGRSRKSAVCPGYFPVAECSSRQTFSDLYQAGRGRVYPLGE
mgnify:CR=1 FL=1